MARLASTIVLVLLLVGRCGDALAANVDPRADRIATLVLACQLPSGGIADTPNDAKQSHVFLTSYNFGGLALAKAYQTTHDAKYADACRRFIEFWLDHQNDKPDRFGVVGTMYDQDYIRASDTVKPHVYDASSPPNKGGPGYDAADADPPIIAITAYQYFLATGDLDLLKRHHAARDRIGEAMSTMLDPRDGLTWAHPKYKIKYLMDAAEAQAGFDALSHIADACGLHIAAKENAILAIRMRRGIASLWSDKHGCFDWNKDEAGHAQACDWSKVYPDAMEQLWPALWGAEDAQSLRTIAAWKAFVAHRPDWPQSDELLTWPQTAIIASGQGEKDSARRQIDRIVSTKLDDDRWEVNQMYFVLLACTEDAR
jgi:hypothetical protein